MGNIPTEKLGTSDWLTSTDIRKLEKMYKCKPKHERIKDPDSELCETITVHVTNVVNDLQGTYRQVNLLIQNFTGRWRSQKVSEIMFF